MKNFLTTNEAAQYYECGFSCDHAIVLVVDGEKFFITDARYTLEASEEIKNAGTSGVSVVESDELSVTAREILVKQGAKECVVDPCELTYQMLNEFIHKTPQVKFVLEDRFHQKKRSIKEQYEIEYIKNSAKVNTEIFAKIAEFLSKNGWRRTEWDLQFTIKQFLMQFGKRELSFEPIFAINQNSAKPHAYPSDERLEYEGSVLLDAGIKEKRYCSDRTRTAFFGYLGLNFNTSQYFSDPEKQKIYDTVLKAHDKAIEAAREGIAARELDAVARGVIEEAGYGKFFTHSLGHGVGLEIHEEPYINRKNEAILQNGMVFTIEPGIYVPNFFGVRIEDMVLLKNSQAVVL
ncbi:aminopeptidase [Campylobacterota bacterium]|nr:aminopeptidase [Campylobacterota bacterium]